MSAWLLPDYIADILPSEASHIENMRRALLDTAKKHGHQLIIPPLIEHIESLLTGTGQAMNLQTFKLIDQLSGRTLGLRADTTPQAARIDSHLLGQKGITRLCYCGPVLHTRPDKPHATREPLQFGAEIYGHSARGADIAIINLALDCLHAIEIKNTEITLDLAHAGLVKALLSQENTIIKEQTLEQIYTALSAKDASALKKQSAELPHAVQKNLENLLKYYGGIEILEQAKKELPQTPTVQKAIEEIKQTAVEILDKTDGKLTISIDLADISGWGYYNGLRFAIYSSKTGSSLLRGGRYDGVGSVFGHQLDHDRAAVGFSLDVKQLARATTSGEKEQTIYAPHIDTQETEKYKKLQEEIQKLRQQGFVVITLLENEQISEIAKNKRANKKLIWQEQADSAKWQLVAEDF